MLRIADIVSFFTSAFLVVAEFFRILRTFVMGSNSFSFLSMSLATLNLL